MDNKSIDITYCYVEDATNNPSWGETYKTCDPKTYADADKVSARLYQDILSIWSNRLGGQENKQGFPEFKFIPNGKCSIRETTQNLFKETGTRYASDFIGVNRKLAHLAGISDSEIVEYLKKQRTIGGHMLFPVGAARSINQARGCNMLDRFDFTLAELREYFIHLSTDNGDYEAKYSRQLGKSFKLHKAWFMRFCCEKDSGITNFKRFVDYWLLGMFVSQDKECKVISLVSSDLENGKECYIEPKDTEPYFPGLTAHSEWVNIRGIKNVLSTGQYEKKDVRKAFVKYIENTNFLVDKRNHMIEKTF